GEEAVIGASRVRKDIAVEICRIEDIEYPGEEAHACPGEGEVLLAAEIYDKPARLASRVLLQRSSEPGTNRRSVRLAAAEPKDRGDGKTVLLRELDGHVECVSLVPVEGNLPGPGILAGRRPGRGLRRVARITLGSLPRVIERRAEESDLALIERDREAG